MGFVIFYNFSSRHRVVRQRSCGSLSGEQFITNNQQNTLNTQFRQSSLFQRGFTLIELLIVLVVMGIALGMVMVQLMPDKRAPLREEAGRLALLLENAGLEARSSGRSMAWSGEKNNYRFFVQKNIGIYKDWVRIDDDSSFRPRSLPEEISISEVSVEEQTLKPSELIFLSTNSYALPFRIRLSSKFGGATVIGKSTGDVIFELDEQPADNPTQ